MFQDLDSNQRWTIGRKALHFISRFNCSDPVQLCVSFLSHLADMQTVTPKNVRVLSNVLGDNGAISPVIQSTNQSVSRVLDQELMCAPKEKTQDLIRNAKWNGNAQFPRHVLSQCCAILRACGNKSMSPWWNMRIVQTILPMKMSILLDHSIKHGAISLVEQHS